MKTKKTLLPNTLVNANMHHIQKLGGAVSINQMIDYGLKDIFLHTLPKEKNIDVAMEKSKECIQSDLVYTQLTILLNINNWHYKSRQVYRFDETLSEILIEQAKSKCEITIDAIKKLPCSCFFVELESKKGYGFFVDIMNDSPQKCDIVISEIKSDGNWDTFMFPVEYGKTIESSITEMVEAERKRKIISKEKVEIEMLEFAKDISQKMQFLLYLSAVNAEILPITKGAITNKEDSPQKNKEDSPPKQPKSKNKTEISEVGFRIGTNIRSYRKSSSVHSDKTTLPKGSAKVPHLRRSHFHSYWVGHGENKTLLVKWVNAVFVNGEKSDIIPTVHRIK